MMKLSNGGTMFNQRRKRWPNNEKYKNLNLYTSQIWKNMCSQLCERGVVFVSSPTHTSIRAIPRPVLGLSTACMSPRYFSLHTPRKARGNITTAGHGSRKSARSGLPAQVSNTRYRDMHKQYNLLNTACRNNTHTNNCVMPGSIILPFLPWKCLGTNFFMLNFSEKLI